MLNSPESTTGGLPLPAAALLGLLADAPNLDSFFDQVAHIAAEVVAPAVACGITLHHDGRPYTVANTNQLAVDIDEIQYGADEGPCLEALSTGNIVVVNDMTTDTRWSRYRPHAIEHGVVSSLSLPLRVNEDTVAALNLYAAGTDVFTDSVSQQAQALVTQCAAALTVILRQADHARLQTQLGQAMASRSVIDQAIGILMAQQRCTASAAFDLLRQASQHRNRKLRDIAADLIIKVTGSAPENPPDFKPPNASG